jgi:hypothetical protein
MPPMSGRRWGAVCAGLAEGKRTVSEPQAGGKRYPLSETRACFVVSNQNLFFRRRNLSSDG